MTIAAPVILQEMQEWLKLGGGNSGIVGDPNHDYGFHIGARYLPASDYSRRRDPNGSDGPYVNWGWACAGDFSHKNKETLRAHHRKVLSGLMSGKYPMICEFIGKPWADRPVYYWARWNGISTLQRYTGFGHDHWSHISWYRSKVNQRANLWVAEVKDMEQTENIDMWDEKGNKPWWAGEYIGATAKDPDRTVAQLLQWGGMTPFYIRKEVLPLLKAILAAAKGASTSEILTHIDKHWAEEKVRDQQAAQRDAEMMGLIHQWQTGEVAAEEILDKLAARLQRP